MMQSKGKERISEEQIIGEANNLEGLQSPLAGQYAEMLRQEAPRVADDFESIVGKYYMCLQDQAQKLLGSIEATQEVLQETWIDLYRESKHNDREWLYSPQRFLWLKTALSRNAFDYVRQQKKNVSLDTTERMWLLEQRTDLFDRPETLLMQDELTQDLYAVMHDVLTVVQLIAL